MITIGSKTHHLAFCRMMMLLEAARKPLLLLSACCWGLLLSNENAGARVSAFVLRTTNDAPPATARQRIHPVRSCVPSCSSTRLFSVQKNAIEQQLPTNRTTPVAPLYSSAASSAADVPAVGTVNGDSSTDAGVDASERVPFPIVLWRFTRPHTLIGSALAIPALHMFAAPTLNAALSAQCLVSMLYSMFPALLMNLYITGLNQVTDVEIDKINKPYLPIAAGILSKRTAIAVCLVALAASLACGVAHPVLGTRGLNVALWGSGILGTLYSLPPFRLKRFPFLAAFCIVAVRGTIINASFFAHAKAAVFGDPTATVLGCILTDPRCLWSSLFFGVFGLVIAIMKDVPDVLGDKISDIRTFSVRVGPQRIFHAARRILTGLFAFTGLSMVRMAVVTAKASSSSTTTTAPLVASRLVTAACAVAAGLSVRQQSAAVDPENPGQVYQYYMHLWKIFYLCYLILPLAR